MDSAIAQTVSPLWQSAANAVGGGGRKGGGGGVFGRRGRVQRAGGAGGGGAQEVSALLRAGGATVSLHASPGGHGLAAADLLAAQEFFADR